MWVVIVVNVFVSVSLNRVYIYIKYFPARILTAAPPSLGTIEADDEEEHREIRGE